MGLISHLFFAGAGFAAGVWCVPITVPCNCLPQTAVESGHAVVVAFSRRYREHYTVDVPKIEARIREEARNVPDYVRALHVTRELFAFCNSQNSTRSFPLCLGAG